MDITCPKCQALYRNLPEKFKNRSVRCKKCNHLFSAVEVISPQKTVLAPLEEANKQPSDRKSVV